MSRRISSNCFTEDVRNLLQSFAHSIRKKDGMISLVGASSPLADAILDRIVQDAYMINIQSIDPSRDVSMLEVYGLDKSLRA